MSSSIALAALIAAGTFGAETGASVSVRIHLTCSASATECDAMYAALGGRPAAVEATRYTTEPVMKLEDETCRAEGERQVCEGV